MSLSSATPIAADEPAAEIGTLRRRAAFIVMVASGFAGLGYQIVWTQQFALWLGHEAAAVLAVLTAFFGGLGLGALALGKRIERSGRPERWYAVCELTIAFWSVALALAMAPVSGWLLALTGAEPTPVRQWTVAFVGTFVALLPATAAMGATLPAMERVLARMHKQRRSIGALYASNTFGAVLGVLGAAFWLVPQLGLASTAALCGALNVACAAAAPALTGAGVTAPASPVAAPRSPAGRRVLFVLAATGLLGIGYEVLVVRVLSQVTEDTVYTFAILLAIYLAGTALGAAAWQRWLSGRRDARATGDGLMRAVALACLLGALSLWAAEGIGAAVRPRAGAGMAGALSAEAVLALAAFALPTVAMGALFSHLCTEARAAGLGFGRSLGVNTLAAAAAPLLFGIVLVPALGAKTCLLLVAAGYLALLPPRSWLGPAALGTAAAIAAVAIWAPPLAFVEVPEGGHIVSYEEGTMAAVSVVEDAGGVSRLRINNRQQEGSSASLLADARQAWLPLLLHPQPRRALFLGLGTGTTAAAAAEDPALQVDAAELLPEVIAASDYFTRSFAGGAPHPRLHLIAADARRFVRTTRSSYDVIVSDNFHPARSGSGALYTFEHFEAVRARLAPGGVFCQWLPLHQLDLETLASIVRSFLAAYPAGSAMLAGNSLQTPVLGLVGRADGVRFDLREVRERLATTVLPARLGDLGVADELALLGSFVAGPRSLARFAETAALNTDDRPVVAYRAPRVTYAAESIPRDRLTELLRQVDVDPAESVDAASDPALARRLSAYRAARKLFIEAGRDVRPTADGRRTRHAVAGARALAVGAAHQP